MDSNVPNYIKKCNIDIDIFENSNKALENGYIYRSWKISTIISIPTKEDLTDPNDHRGMGSFGLRMNEIYDIGLY